jgi:Ferritin-like domain
VVSPRGRRSRRELLAASGVLLGAVVLDGCGGGSSSTPVLQTAPSGDRTVDVEILNRAIDLEFKTVAAYTAGIPLLNGAAAKAAKQYLSQELSHANELQGLVKEAGGTAHQQKAYYNLGRPRGATDVLMLLNRLENQQVRLYIDQVSVLSPGPVRAAVSAILANDAQHMTVLRSALGRPPAPTAFVAASP